MCVCVCVCRHAYPCPCYMCVGGGGDDGGREGGGGKCERVPQHLLQPVYPSGPPVPKMQQVGECPLTSEFEPCTPQLVIT